ncbi:MAG TPA: hypothetical protein VIF62_17420 [Labilithrix sp.]
MTTGLLRALEHVHGHLGWLAVAALLHPAILLRNPKRRARLAVTLSTAFVVTVAALGATIYPHYRDRIKQHLFLEAPTLGWMFERKEHLAVGAVVFAVVGCVAHLTLPSIADEDIRRTTARLAHRAFVIAFALASIAAALGVAVAVHATF